MSREAEQAVLGAALLESKWAMEAVNSLDADMFEGVNRDIFQKIVDLYWAGKPVDFVTVMEGFSDDDKEYMWKLVNEVPSLVSVPEYIRIVRADWQSKKITTALSKFVFTPGDVETTLDELDALVKEHRALLQAAEGDGVTSFTQAVEDFFSWLQERENREAHLTGLTRFDRVVGGFQPGTVFTLAARPGGGKTDFALNLALRLAKRGTKVLYFTLEMTNVLMIRRVASYATHINSILIRDNALSDADKSLMRESVKAFTAGNKLGFVEEPRISVGKVAHFVDLWKPEVVFIDHIGLMKRPKTNSDYRGLGLVSNQLHELAVKKKIAIVQLSQMNRQIESRKSGGPNLSDLRESGDLEQDSDNVAFLVPEKVEGQKVSGSGYIDVKLKFSKNREGDQGVSIPLKWQPQYHTYSEVEDRYDR